MADEGTVDDPPESVDDFLPGANSSLAEDAGVKKVTVDSDEPVVFQFDPDSTEVQQVEKPAKPRRPKAEGVPKAEQDRIMAELRADVERAQRRITDQKLKLQRVAFILDKMQTNMEEYQAHLRDNFTRFLINNDALQADWFTSICHRLPDFGDYTLVLRDSDEPIPQDGVAGSVSERELLGLAGDVAANLFGAGSLLKHHLTLCRDIGNRLAKKTGFVDGERGSFPRWRAALEAEDSAIRRRVQELFQVTSRIAFLGLRDQPTIAPLDVSLNKSRANLNDAV